MVISATGRFAGSVPAHGSSPLVRRISAFIGREAPPANLTAETHTRDYTQPSYITMLFTDLGVLTPSAVSDELIKLFD